jgi:hypothetical protein
MALKGKRMSMRKSRKMRRSRGMSMSKKRTMRRSRSMRGGGISGSSDESTGIASSSATDLQDQDRNQSDISGEGPAVGGPVVPQYNPNVPMSGGRRRRRRSMRMRGGDDMNLPTVGSARQMYDGGRKRSRSRRGGSLVATAAVPFGLWGLQRYFSGNRGSAEGSQHRRRRHRRS